MSKIELTNFENLWYFCTSGDKLKVFINWNRPKSRWIDFLVLRKKPESILLKLPVACNEGRAENFWVALCLYKTSLYWYQNENQPERPYYRNCQVANSLAPVFWRYFAIRIPKQINFFDDRLTCLIPDDLRDLGAYKLFIVARPYAIQAGWHKQTNMVVSSNFLTKEK